MVAQHNERIHTATGLAPDHLEAHPELDKKAHATMLANRSLKYSYPILSVGTTFASSRR